MDTIHQDLDSDLKGVWPPLNKSYKSNFDDDLCRYDQLNSLTGNDKEVTRRRGTGNDMN